MDLLKAEIERKRQRTEGLKKQEGWFRQADRQKQVEQELLTQQAELENSRKKVRLEDAPNNQIVEPSETAKPVTPTNPISSSSAPFKAAEAKKEVVVEDEEDQGSSSLKLEIMFMNDKEAKLRLRELHQPITLFGEDNRV